VPSGVDGVRGRTRVRPRVLQNAGTRLPVLRA
jgi:hypothetical protein